MSKEMREQINKVKNWKQFLKESVFVSKDEIDTLLDKISSSGINSLSDIEKNRLILFSDEDKEIIKTIEQMGDITNEFRELNQRMNKLSSEGKNEEAHSLMSYWMELNDKLRPLEQSFRKWGIELGDERLDNLMRKVRPDAYNRGVIDNID
jgi:vacuolar-type H+-ATPase subunit I/STV1